MESILSHFASGEPVVFTFFFFFDIITFCQVFDWWEWDFFVSFLIILISLLFAYVLL